MAKDRIALASRQFRQVILQKFQGYANRRRPPLTMGQMRFADLLSLRDDNALPADYHAETQCVAPSAASVIFKSPGLASGASMCNLLNSFVTMVPIGSIK